MDVITQNSNGLVIFAEEGLTLTEDGAAGSDWVFPAATPGSYTLYQGVTLPDGFALGLFTYVAGVFAQVPDTAAMIAAALADRLAALGAYRYDVMTGGTTVSGVPVQTDDVSLTRISGALQLVQQVPATTVQFKVSDGSFVTLDAVQIAAVAVTVGQFIQSCFTAEATHTGALKALLTVAAIQAYDFTTGWPQGT